MESMVRYMAAEMSACKGSVRDLYSQLARQKAFNRKVIVLGVAFGVYAFLRMKEQDERINLLYRKIKQLEEETDEA